jgi:hypothetical protein
MATDAKARGTGVATAVHPRVRLVRAFNALSFVQVEKDAHRAGEKLGIPVAGDDPAAVKTVVQLVIDSASIPWSRAPRQLEELRHRHRGLREGHDRQADQGHAEAAVVKCRHSCSYRRVARKLVLKRVRTALQALGHEVFTPALTGVGERAHLLSREINLDTHIDDVVNLIRWEELSNVVLCGHSYGGAVIAGAADRVPSAFRPWCTSTPSSWRTAERARHLAGRSPGLAAGARARRRRRLEGAPNPRRGLQRESDRP